MNRSGTDRDIVLSSRIRLARNVEGMNFVARMTPSEKEALYEDIAREVESNPVFGDFTIYNIDDLDEIDRIVLKEKKIISERFYRSGSGLVAIDDPQQTSIVTGDLDHIRISSFADGLSIDDVLERSLSVERNLAEIYPFAQTEEDGYLTANISDRGTAMKGSVFLHLPVLSASDLMDHLIIDTIETRLEVTGFSGGGSQSLGGVYIISNRCGHERDERAIPELLGRSVSMFADHERELREDLLAGKFPMLEDRIFRSYGLLRYCRQISEQEAFSALSLLRLGVAVRWISDLELADFQGLFRSIGNGYLRSFAYESKPDENDIMRLRAETIRDRLKFNL